MSHCNSVYEHILSNENGSEHELQQTDQLTVKLHRGHRRRLQSRNRVPTRISVIPTLTKLKLHTEW